MSEKEDMSYAKTVSGLDDPATAANYLTGYDNYYWNGYYDYYWKREG